MTSNIKQRIVYCLVAVVVFAAFVFVNVTATAVFPLSLSLHLPLQLITIIKKKRRMRTGLIFLKIQPTLFSIMLTFCQDQCAIWTYNEIGDGTFTTSNLGLIRPDDFWALYGEGEL